MEFTQGELRLKGLRWELVPLATGNGWMTQLRSRGFDASRQGNDLVVRQAASS